jgi:glycosyltransferase involved in cell wall biosynthesis
LGIKKLNLVESSAFPTDSSPWVILEPQAYYDHGHWVQSALVFKSLLNDSGHFPKVVFPKRVRGFDLQGESFRQSNHETFLFSFENSQPMVWSWINVASSLTVKLKSESPIFIPVKLFIWMLVAPIVQLQRYLYSKVVSFRNVSNLKALGNLVMGRFLFPTADNFALTYPLVKFLISQGASGVYLRFVNSEPLGVSRWVKKLERRDIDASKIFLAVENRNMLETFLTATKKVSLVPYPPAVRVFSKESKPLKNSQTALVLGMLGAPAEHKGYSFALEMARYVNDNRQKYSFMVQAKSEPDPVRKDISRIDNCILLSEKLGRVEFEAALQSLDVLVLPYDRQIYRETSSAMLMEAADFLVPVIVPSGTGLATDVESFGLGWVYRTLPDLFSILNRISSDTAVLTKAQKSIDAFNVYRRDQAISWLLSTPVRR